MTSKRVKYNDTVSQNDGRHDFISQLCARRQLCPSRKRCERDRLGRLFHHSDKDWKLVAKDTGTLLSGLALMVKAEIDDKDREA